MSRLFRFILVASLYLTVAWPASVLADTFPIRAFVQEPATLHSGPSDQFYATQRLEIGTAVEIYKTTDDGWCGIRPLPNSFSLIPADAITETPDSDVIRLNRQAVRTQVGSLISAKQDVKYVTLNKGEPVKSLGRTDDGAWFKIAPPSGEFRWIHRRFLGSETPSNEIATIDTAKNGPVTREAAQHDPLSNKQDGVELAGFNFPIPEDKPVGSSVRGVSNQNQSPPSIDANLVEGAQAIDSQEQMTTVPIEGETPDNKLVNASANATAEPNTNDAWKVRETQTGTAISTNSLAPAKNTKEVLSPSIKSELQQINVALSQIVTQETSKWELVTVRMRTERIIDSAQTQADRQSGRELLGRIGEFENLKHRYDQMSGRTPASQPRPLSQLARRSPATTNANDRSDKLELAAFLQSNNRSDVPRVQQASHTAASTHREAAGGSQTGWLMPVITSNPRMPKFAITDNEGKILCFVSEGAGVKLKSHLRQHVTLAGESGFSSDLEKKHLVATQVVTRR
ncbi:hypothetical protein ACFL2H_07955 [Planctomycetota bacterium]